MVHQKQQTEQQKQQLHVNATAAQAFFKIF